MGVLSGRVPTLQDKDLVLIPSKGGRGKRRKKDTYLLWDSMICVNLSSGKNTLWSVDTIYHMIYGGLGIDFMAGGFIW